MSEPCNRTRGPTPASFTWRPGDGPREDGIRRMRDHLPMPLRPMGEAWFMSEERRMFSELLGNLNALDLEQLRDPLDEIASGNACFGPMKEWTDWFHYLLPQLISRHAERSFDSLYQHLVTAFIAVHPRGIEEPYPGFADDARQSLGRCLMDAERWLGGRLAAPPPEDPFNGGRGTAFAWNVACGDFSAGMFFCAKYLPEDALESWLDSAFAIDCPLWNTQLYGWLLDARPLLTRQVMQLADLDDGPDSFATWLGSHVLSGDFSGIHGPEPTPIPLLSSIRCDAVLAAVEKHVSLERHLSWLEAIKPYAYLQTMLGGRPNRFAETFRI